MSSTCRSSARSWTSSAARPAGTRYLRSVRVIRAARSAMPSRSIPGRTAVTPSKRPAVGDVRGQLRSEEHTSELQSRFDLVCRLLLEKKKIVQDMLGLDHNVKISVDT